MLTVKKCSQNIICRGLIRIQSVLGMEKIVRYLTLKGYVNFGLLPTPRDLHLMPENKVWNVKHYSISIISWYSGIILSSALGNVIKNVMPYSPIIGFNFSEYLNRFHYIGSFPCLWSDSVTSVSHSCHQTGQNLYPYSMVMDNIIDSWKFTST